MITYGTNPGMGMGITAAVPSPDAEPDEAGKRALTHALDYMGLSAGQSLLGQKVDIVFIGSCTNSRISDLREAADIFRGNHVADGLRVMVVPGSAQVKAQAEREGLDDVFRSAGAEWREAGCSMCIAMNGDQGAPGQYIVSTSNRNFEGRQGKGARTFLASPLTAAATALAGVVSDPRPLVGRMQPSEATEHGTAGPNRQTHPHRSRQMPEPYTHLQQQAHPAARRERRHRPDHPRPIPQDDREVGPRERPVQRLALPAGRQPQPGLRAQPARDAGPPGAARGRQLRRRLVPRARAVGAHRVGHQGHHQHLVRGHLPNNSHEERAAAHRGRPGHAPAASRRCSRPTRTRGSPSTCPSWACCCRTARRSTSRSTRSRAR